VLDYLTEEVLERQSEDIRTFLMHTSVLERLSGPLCDAVAGRTGSQAMLEQVERAGLFLVPLDDVRGWWRYHHLFADLLRARLGRDSEQAAQLHRNAAIWYDEHGLADDAIHHTLAAGDTVRAARLVEEHFDTVFNLRGEEATIQRWLPRIARPRRAIASTPAARTSTDGSHAWRRTDDGAADRRGRASIRNRIGRTVRTNGRQRRQSAGQRPRGDRTATQLHRPTTRRRRDHGYPHCSGAASRRCGRGDAQLCDPRLSRDGGVATRSAGGGRTGFCGKHRRVASRRSDHHGGMG